MTPEQRYLVRQRIISRLQTPSDAELTTLIDDACTRLEQWHTMWRPTGAPDLNLRNYWATVQSDLENWLTQRTRHALEAAGLALGFGYAESEESEDAT